MRPAYLDADRLAREAVNRERNRRQAALLMAGNLEDASAVTQAPAPLADHVSPRDRLGQERAEALAAVWPLRKSVKAPPILKTNLRPQQTRVPVAFPYHVQGGSLGKLNRPLSAAWMRVLTSISAAGLVGGRVLGNEGRNLAHVVAMLRSYCYLKVDAEGRPDGVRESVALVVDGGPEGHSFARDCGMSRATFYRALRHPLAHLFLRTQKVQEEDEDGARENKATLFMVAMYDPPIPPDLEAVLYAAPVEIDGVFVVLDSTSQDAPTERPLTTLKRNESCGNVERLSRGLSAAGLNAQQQVQAWEDAAPLGSRAAGVMAKGELESDCSVIHVRRPDLWELASHIAVSLDEQHPHAAAVTYYKALVWLGTPVVRAAFQVVKRHQAQGRAIENPGAVFTARLNAKARAQHGYNLRDLALNGGGMAS